MLRLTEVSAGYDGGFVVSGISLNLDSGAAIIGPNGCGKTTLLKAIAGILPHKGEIAVCGRPVSKMKRREAASRLAMLSQQPGAYFGYSARDTVMMGRYLRIKGRGGLAGLPSKADNEAVDGAMRRLGLSGESGRPVTKLSGGQLQRVFLAQAIVQEPDVILLDEPTNHLDLACQVQLIDYLKEWALEGDRLVVGVLHDINLAMRLSHRLVVMQGGAVRADGGGGEIIASGVLDEVYGMDVAAYMRGALGKWRE